MKSETKDPREKAKAMWARAYKVHPSRLNSRLREVAQLVAESHTLKSIAPQIRISHKAVGYHFSKLCNRLGMPRGSKHRQTHIAIVTRWAIEHRLCHPECLTP